MDFALVVIFVVLMVGGFALGMLLSLARPSDEDAAAMHRHQAQRALARLPGRFRSGQGRMQPAPDSGSHA